MELSGVEKNAGYAGTVLSVNCLVEDGSVVRVAIELGIKREIVVIFVIVLVAFDV